MAERSSHVSRKRDLELMAEWLALEQLDLLAQVEAQLRSVHRTMRAIEKLRGGEHHVGPELSNGERGTVLTGLADEVGVLEEQLSAQEGCCHAMMDTVDKMQKRLAESRQRRTETDSDEGPRQST